MIFELFFILHVATSDSKADMENAVPKLKFAEIQECVDAEVLFNMMDDGKFYFCTNQNNAIGDPL